MNTAERDLFSKALLEGEARDFAKLPPESELDWRVSPRFEKRMQKLLRNPAAGGGVGRVPVKRAVLIVAILALLLALSLTAYAFREPIKRIFLERYQAFTRYFTSDTADPKHSASEDGARWTLTRTPEGFHEMYQYADGGRSQTVWENQNGERISVARYPSDFDAALNTERAELTRLEIDRFGAHDGYTFTDGGVVCILWSEGDDVFVCTFSESLPFDEMKRLFERDLAPQ